MVRSCFVAPETGRKRHLSGKQKGETRTGTCKNRTRVKPSTRPTPIATRHTHVRPGRAPRRHPRLHPLKVISLFPDSWSPLSPPMSSHTSYRDCRGAKCTPRSPAACHAAGVHTPQCGIDDGAHSSIPAEASHTRTRAHTQTNAHCAHTFTITRTRRRIAGRIRRAGFQVTLTKPQRDAREGPRFELTTVSRRTTRLDLVPLLLLGCSFQLGH